MRWLRRLRALLVVGALGLLLALVGYRSLAQSQSRELDVFGDAPAFALIDQLGRPVSSEEFRGKVVIANFIYTHCRDTCPLLSLRMQALQERLQEEKLLGGQVQLLSFTTDPARDTPDVLRAYAERHRADPQAWRFLTGPEGEMVRIVVEGFKLGVQEVPLSEATPHTHADGAEHEAYDVMHSNRFVLIDRQGRIRVYYDGLDLDAEQVVRDVRQLLR